MNLLIENGIIVSMERAQERYFIGSVGIVDDRIAVVTGEKERIAAFKQKHNPKVINADGRVVMPGLINTHNHIAMTLMRGYADDLYLMPWLNDYIWPAEKHLTESDIYAGTQLGIAEMLLGGITASLDMYWYEATVWEAVKESGFRAVVSPGFTDAKWEDFKKDFAGVMDRVREDPCDRISVTVSAHSPYSCSTERLREAKRMADEHGLGFNIHLAETKWEDNFIREKYGKSPVEYASDLGLLAGNTLAAHCVHLDRNDIEIFAASGASVAHNPQSNMKLGSGVAPIAEMIRLGINVSIGTDGACSNNDLNMWEEMRSATFMQKLATHDPTVLSAYETLEAATINGARALGLDGVVGSIKEGKYADIIVIDMCKPHLVPQYDVISNLVYAANASDVCDVIVAGSIVVENRKLKSIDLDKLYPEIERKSKKFSKITNKA